MAITSGFFPSDGGDRKYSAAQFSNMFDGIILDGVFATVGDAFSVTVDDESIVLGTGRAWFNHTWTYNDEPIVLTPPDPDVDLPRIDALVLEVRLENRKNEIKFITGTPSSNPSRPGMEYDNGEGVYQYPLAYISRKADDYSISQTDIDYVVGKECPIVTGPLQVMSIASYVAQFEAMFMEWFSVIKGQIGTDLGTSLQSQINSLGGEQTTMKSDMGMIEGDIAFIEENITSIVEDLGSISDDLEQLNTELIEIKNEMDEMTLPYSNATPKAASTVGSAGYSQTVSRGDHQHPVDTSRAEAHGYGTIDPGAGSSLATGRLYLVYE